MTNDEFRTLRLGTGLSIRRAATALGVTAQTIQRWEAGESRIPSEAAERMRAESRDVDDTLTRSERTELVSLLHRRARVAKGDAKARTAVLLAEFEQRMATIFEPTEEAWREAVEIGERAIEAANEAIKQHCRERGVPEKWMPSVQTYWSGRGETRWAERRAELRKVATSRLAELEKTAVAAIERQAVEAETALVAAGLRSTQARAVLEALPSAEALMPSSSLVSLLPSPTALRGETQR